MSTIIHIKSVTQIHQMLGLQSPKHPLISVIDMHKLPRKMDFGKQRFSSELFMISLKDGISGSINYGRNSYDFEDGTIAFSKPHQVLSSINKEINDDAKGWTLLFHTDLIRKSALGKTISQYSFFDYEVHEALHLSEDEQQTVTDLVRKIEKEYLQNIDKHSQKLIVTNIELLLNYCTRYYDRQFYVRTNLNQDHVAEFETMLQKYFDSDKPINLGVPSVKYCGEQLHMSSNYLSDLLKKETGKSAKEHIYAFVVGKAKTKLLGTTATISEIAYDLGFEYPQHFSKLFKKQTGISPAKYRSLN